MRKRAWVLFLVSLTVTCTALTLYKLRVLANAKQDSEQRLRSNATEEANTRTPPMISLQGTEPLKLPEDILERQRQQISEYFLKQIAATPNKRDKLWQPDFSSAQAFQSSVQVHRSRLRKILGLIEPRTGKPEIRVLQEDESVRVEDVAIPLDTDFRLQALLFVPRAPGQKAVAIAIPPANQSREEFAGIARDMTPAKWLTTLLEHRVAVAIPTIVERRADHPLCEKTGGQDRRRILWRLGFIVGRTLVGLDVQQVLALGDFLASQPEIDSRRIAVFGKDQGGMTALYAAAVDERLAGATVIDYFQEREECWKEPIDQTLCGQLNEFGDAEVAALVAPRPLAIVSGPGEFPSVEAEVARARRFYQGLRLDKRLTAVQSPDDSLEAGASTIVEMLGATQTGNRPVLTVRIPEDRIEQSRDGYFESLYRYLRRLCEESDGVRSTYWNLDSTSPSDRLQKAAKLRAELAHLVGVIPDEGTPLHPRTALIGETDKFLAYEVLLDVVPGVEAYGHLLVPRMVAGNLVGRLPAVICQHGYGGAPKYVSGVGKDLESDWGPIYHRFGERLAERGYVVFAPYLSVPISPELPSTHSADLVNPLVRQAVCLGLMRSSIELAKLHRVVDFLQSLPFVDAQKIGYYGLSYGGYSAMWMGPLEPRLKITIISAYFNDWRLDLTYDKGYFGKVHWSLPHEDFFNWNVLNRFTHTELIAAMWPHPVCIEYGLDDNSTNPEWHRLAWQDLRTKYVVPWSMADKIIDDVFVGPHEIHGIGTFFSLDRWLRPERAAGRDYGCRDYDYCLETVAPGFHGYAPISESVPPYITQFLDSGKNSVVRGNFYVSNGSPVFASMAVKVARVGLPGDLLIRFGSAEGAADVGEARILARDVYPGYDLWYEAKLKKPKRLDPGKLYFFEVTAESARSPENGYTLYGVKPLGSKDFPSKFSLAFQVRPEGAGLSSAF